MKLSSSSSVVLRQEHQATGNKLVLAPLRQQHIVHLMSLARNPALAAEMGWDTCFEPDQSDQFIAAISAHTLPYSRNSPAVLFGIFLPAAEMPIGYAILKGINPELATAEVGVAILEPHLQRKGGYGRLALERLLIYAEEELQIQTVAATILASNRQSINGAKRAGLKIRELMPQSWPMPDGSLADMVWMEWTATKS